MLRHGIPADVVTALRAVSASFRALGRGGRGHPPARDGEQLHLRDRTLRVLHRPGHSPSDTVFHDEARSILLAGDHLIAHISSNPLLARPLDAASPTVDRTRARRRSSTTSPRCERTRAMELVARAAGPRRADRRPRALIDERLRLHDRRAEKIHGLIAAAPRTAHEIALRAVGQRRRHPGLPDALGGARPRRPAAGARAGSWRASPTAS